MLGLPPHCTTQRELYPPGESTARTTLARFFKFRGHYFICRISLEIVAFTLKHSRVRPLSCPAEKPAGLAMCVGCGSQIHDQYILRVSPDLEWHAACLKCAECSQYLDESCTCFVRDGKTYCKRDYVRYGSGKYCYSIKKTNHTCCCRKKQETHTQRLSNITLCHANKKYKYIYFLEFDNNIECILYPFVFDCTETKSYCKKCNQTQNCQTYASKIVVNPKYI